jgi:hypothetical protein
MLLAKGIREFIVHLRIDYATAVCEPTEVNLPAVFPFALQTLQWPFDDPVGVSPSVTVFRWRGSVVAGYNYGVDAPRGG